MKLFNKYLKHLSVSSINLHIANPVKWSYIYLEGRREVREKEYLVFDCIPYYQYGKMIHALIEIHVGKHRTRGITKAYEEFNGIRSEYLGESMERNPDQEIALLKLTDMLQSYIDQEEIYVNPETEHEFIKNLEIPPKRRTCSSGACTSAPLLIPIKGYIDVLVQNYDEGRPLIIDHKLKKKTFYKPRMIGADVQFLTYAWATSVVGALIQVNEFLPNNKSKLLKVNRVEVSGKDIKRHEQEWLIPQVRAVLNTIEAYDKGGIEKVYELYNKCDSCCNAYNTECGFYSECYGLNTEVDWL
jgi:hypothetical protein